ncbi:MAG: hypothetical protein Kow0010_22500 [Dehalococcoidia bacterium]
MPDTTTAVCAFEDYELDVARFELRRRGERVPMEPQVFEVLAYLVHNHDRVVGKDELIEHVWPNGFITDAALNSRVMAARRAIGDTGKDQRLIRTIRGRGYRFIGDVAEESPSAHERRPAPAATATLEAPQGRTISSAFGLDVAATSFVGREAELERLAEMLRRPACRLITIAGPGGVGKTRLVAELTQRLEAEGRDVATVALQPIQNAHEFRVAIAGALGLRLRDVDPASIAEHVGDRDTVLVLDNFEHLAGEATGDISAIVQGTPALDVVVTSREVLGLREEWLFPIGGLAYEGDAAASSDAVRLFLEREAQASGGPPAADDNDPALGRICRLVDGMPLGIELAASLRRYLSRAEIAERISQDLDVLRSDLRNLPQRHRSIPGLLDESFRRLTEEQLATLLALAVFEGSFTIQAASRIANAPLGIVGDLVDRSLVQPRHGRFALHPLLRQHARDRLGNSFAEHQRAHAEYIADFLARRRDALEGEGQITASAEIDEELPNILAAWRWACDNGRLDLIDQAAYPLYMYAHLRSRFAEVREALEWGRVAAERAGAGAWRTAAALAMYHCWALIRTSRGADVLRAGGHAALLFESHNEPPPPGFGTDPVAIDAMVEWGRGRYDGTRDIAEVARQRAVEREDPYGEAFALWLSAVGRVRLATLRWHVAPDKSGRYSPAAPEDEATLADVRLLLDRTASLLERTGERWFLSNIAMERAAGAKGTGDLDLCERLTWQAYEIRAEFGDSRGMADALIALADVCIDRADPDGAMVRLLRSKPIVDRLGEAALVVEYERASALMAWLRVEHDAALSQFARVAELSSRIVAINNVIAALRGIGDILLDREQYAAAAEILSFVARHRASTPWARARATTSLERLATVLSAEELARAAERSASAHLGTYAPAVVARFTPPPA